MIVVILLSVAALQIVLVLILGWMMHVETVATKEHTEEMRRHAQEMSDLIDRLKETD